MDANDAPQLLPTEPYRAGAWGGEARRHGMAPRAIKEARFGSVGHPEVLEKLKASQFASAAPVCMHRCMDACKNGWMNRWMHANDATQLWPTEPYREGVWEGGAPARYGSEGHNGSPFWLRGPSGSATKVTSFAVCQCRASMHA